MFWGATTLFATGSAEQIANLFKWLVGLLLPRNCEVMATSRKAPLSVEAIRDALAKGLGRAYLHGRNHGIAGVEDELRPACLNGLVFEPFIEGTWEN